MSFTIGSLFDGSGGFPLAAFLCGGVPVWASEVEPYPIAVTRSRFPMMKHLGDISKINGAEIEPVDVITFGSPCQDLSVAGKRAGLKHEVNGDEETTRSGLFMEAVRIIKEMREATNGRYPTFALWENVPGAFSSNKGEDFRIVLEELVKIVEPTAVMPAVPPKGWAYSDSYCGDGWSLAYRVFDAQYWGVPQRRRRIHLVLDLGGERARKVLFEREGLRGYFAESGTPWQGSARNTQDCVGADDRARDGCVVYSFDSLASNSMKSSNPHSGCRQVEIAKTLDTTDPNPSKNQGGIAIVESVPYTLKIRSGCEGGGKGALIQTDKSATLSTLNDQYLFQPIQEVCVKEQYLFENHSQDTRYKGPLGICPMLPAQLGTGGNNTPFVVENVIPIHDQATRFSGKRGDKSDGKGNGLGVGEPGDPMNTLTSGDRHAVAYTMQGFGDYKDCGVASGLKARDYKDATDLVCEQTPIVLDRAFYNQGVNALYEPQLYDDGTCPTLVAKGPAAVCVRYVVRRLTPTECARLQGFAEK